MKNVFFTFSLGLMVFLGQAQKSDYGLQGGINISSIEGDFAEIFDSSTGYHINFNMEFEFSDKFSLQPSLQYSLQGGKSILEDAITGEYFEDNIKLTYLNMPVLVKYYIFRGFTLEAGPQAGLLLSAKNKWEYKTLILADEYDEASGEEDIKDDFESLDYGIKLGLGYKLNNGLSFAAHYYLGMADITKDNIGSKSQTHAIQIGIGYYFK